MYTSERDMLRCAAQTLLSELNHELSIWPNDPDINTKQTEQLTSETKNKITYVEKWLQNNPK